MTEKNVVKELCDVITKSNLTSQQIADLLPEFLFSVGASLEDCSLQTSEEVLKRYAEKPTFGNALMAQALWMKETWVIPEEERQKKDERELRREGKEREDTDSVQSLQRDQRESGSDEVQPQTTVHESGSEES